MSHTIDISGRPCPCCPHTNGDHDTDGQCGLCICQRRLTVKLIGPGHPLAVSDTDKEVDEVEMRGGWPSEVIRKVSRPRP